MLIFEAAQASMVHSWFCGTIVMSFAHYNSWWSTNFEISRQLSLISFGLRRILQGGYRSQESSTNFEISRQLSLIEDTKKDANYYG